MLLSLMTLCACSGAPARPDPEWLRDTVVTPLPDGPVTNRQLTKLAVDREADVGRCNADKAAVRRWLDEYEARSH